MHYSVLHIVPSSQCSTNRDDDNPGPLLGTYIFIPSQVYMVLFCIYKPGLIPISKGCLPGHAVEKMAVFTEPIYCKAFLDLSFHFFILPEIPSCPHLRLHPMPVKSLKGFPLILMGVGSSCWIYCNTFASPAKWPVVEIFLTISSYLGNMSPLYPS